MTSVIGRARRRAQEMSANDSSPQLRRRPPGLAARACPGLPLVLIGAATLLSGCGGADSNGSATAAVKAQTSTTAVAPPPLPITIESPAERATIRASSLGSAAVIARVRVAGTAEPGGRLLISGHCGTHRCVRHMTVGADGAWSSRLRMVLPRGTRHRTVHVSYLGLRAVPEPAQVRLRIRAPRPTVVRARIQSTGSVQAEGESSAGNASPPPGTQTYTLPAPQSGSLAGSGTLVVVGDSLAEGMASLLPHAFPGWSIRVNSRVGRGLAEGMSVLGQTRVPDGSTLAISLFTNDDPWRTPALADAVHETLSRVGPSGCAIWSTIAAPPVNGLSYAKANALLNRLAATEPRLRVVPWAEQMAANPGLLGGDGVHPTTSGYELRARMYAQAASSCD